MLLWLPLDSFFSFHASNYSVACYDHIINAVTVNFPLFMFDDSSAMCIMMVHAE